MQSPKWGEAEPLLEQRPSPYIPSPENPVATEAHGAFASPKGRDAHSEAPSHAACKYHGRYRRDKCAPSGPFVRGVVFAARILIAVLVLAFATIWARILIDHERPLLALFVGVVMVAIICCVLPWRQP